jgi:glyoxylase-like metal-dependent hydrolase (beta-lactamase superfamily II)
MHLKSLGLALALLCVGSGAPAAGAALETRQLAPDFRWERLAPDVYAFVSNNTTHFWEDGNTTIVVTKDGVIVIDAPTTYLSRRHLAEIRKLTSKPVRYVINTHFHRDHLMGNHVYKDAFPGVQVVQDSYTAMLANRRDPSIMELIFRGKDGADLLAARKKEAETGISEEGKPLSGYDLMRAKRSYAEFLPVYQAAQSARYVPADVTFDDHMTITLGGTEVRLFRMEGHTRGDTVAYLPKEKILVTGDLVIGPVPYGVNDLYDKWIETLDRLETFDADAIVPGHGEVEFDKSYIRQLRALNASLMDQAERAVLKHHSVEEFKKELDLSSFKAAMVGDDPEKQWGWDNYFLDGAAERAWAIAHGDQ